MKVTPRGMLTNPKRLVELSFSFISLYFFGLSVLSIGHPLQMSGEAIIGAIHLGIVVGLLKGEEWGISLGKYIAFIDVIFSILWVMLGVFIQGATLFMLSALTLILLSDPEVTAKILQRA